MIETSAIALSEALDDDEKADELLYPRLTRYVVLVGVLYRTRLTDLILSQHPSDQRAHCRSRYSSSAERGRS